jgi:hypothetical protein
MIKLMQFSSEINIFLNVITLVDELNLLLFNIYALFLFYVFKNINYNVFS